MVVLGLRRSGAAAGVAGARRLAEGRRGAPVRCWAGMDDAGLAELEAAADAYDALADATPDVDPFCSTTDWLVPAQRAFGRGPVKVGFASDGRTAVALAHAPLRGGATALWGLDPMWGFARPVVGPDPAACADALVEVLADDGRWHAAVISGVRPGSGFATTLLARLGPRRRVVREPGLVCQVLRLDDGVEGFLARRSARFRKNARQAARRAEAGGITVELARGGGPEVVERAMAVERRSWKGRRGGGLADPGFARFYLDMAARLTASGRLRAGFARAEGRDVGYILGAVRGRAYRGLQISFDEAWAAWSPGNVLQLAQMSALVAEGVTRYDLGMDMAYKRSWADEAVASETLIVFR
jgi:hypothetical protein